MDEVHKFLDLPASVSLGYQVPTIKILHLSRGVASQVGCPLRSLEMHHAKQLSPSITEHAWQEINEGNAPEGKSAELALYFGMMHGVGLPCQGVQFVYFGVLIISTKSFLNFKIWTASLKISTVSPGPMGHHHKQYRGLRK